MYETSKTEEVRQRACAKETWVAVKQNRGWPRSGCTQPVRVWLHSSGQVDGMQLKLRNGKHSGRPASFTCVCEVFFSLPCPLVRYCKD